MDDGKMSNPRTSEAPVALRGAKQNEYVAPEIFEQELSSIFDNDWVMVGRQNNIPEPTVVRGPLPQYGPGATQIAVTRRGPPPNRIVWPTAAPASAWPTSTSRSPGAWQ